MFRSHFTADLKQKLYAAENTVLADTLFTLPSGAFQLGSGLWLAWYAGYSLREEWLLFSLLLFSFAGLCWLPVVWIQLQLRNMIRKSLSHGTPLPSRYNKLFRIWFLLGWPAFLALVTVVYFMVVKSV